MLLNALITPSEYVQSSVALCLSKLMKKGCTPQKIKTLLNNIMDKCIQGPIGLPEGRRLRNLRRR